MVISDLPDLVGSGQSVGGVVSSTVGATSDPASAPIQLQRIVSRCGCQFFYASFGENVDTSSLEEVPPLVCINLIDKNNCNIVFAKVFFQQHAYFYATCSASTYFSKFIVLLYSLLL